MYVYIMYMYIYVYVLCIMYMYMCMCMCKMYIYMYILHLIFIHYNAVIKSFYHNHFVFIVFVIVVVYHHMNFSTCLSLYDCLTVSINIYYMALSKGKAILQHRWEFNRHPDIIA
jgi:hypothetical protein